METFATIFAGLGLFFIGLSGLTKGMRALTSRRLHHLVQSATSNYWLSSLVGIVTGSATQSATAVTFIVVSMVSSGIIGLGHGLFVTAWSNIGTTILVFLATLNIHFFLDIFIGVLGVSYYFGLDRIESRSTLLSLLVGIALLMLGLVLVKEGVVQLSDNALLLDTISQTSGHLLLLMFIGTLVGIVTQSATSVSAIVVTLVSSSAIFDFNQACSLILGANLGAGISVYLIGRRLSGSAKKIVLIQMLTKVSGVVLVTPVLFFQASSAAMSLQSVLSLGGSTLVAVTLFVLLVQLVAALAMSLLATPILHYLNLIIRDDASEETRKPKYIHKLALEDSESALDLLEKEQFRVISLFPTLMDAASGAEKTHDESLSKSVRALIQQCEEFCLELITRSQNHETLERVLKAQKRNDLLLGINNNIDQLMDHLATRGNNKTSEVLRDALWESLHFVLMFFDEAKDKLDDLTMLLVITGDKSTVMERARESLVHNRANMSEKTLSSMLAATSQFERLIWLINSYAEGVYAERYGSELSSAH